MCRAQLWSQPYSAFSITSVKRQYLLAGKKPVSYISLTAKISESFAPADCLQLLWTAAWRRMKVGEEGRFSHLYSILTEAPFRKGGTQRAFNICLKKGHDGPVVRTRSFHCWGQVQSSVRELISSKPCSAAKKKAMRTVITYTANLTEEQDHFYQKP